MVQGGADLRFCQTFNSPYAARNQLKLQVHGHGAMQSGAKKGATLSHCKYSENSMTELRGNWNIINIILQYYTLNTVINFLFKNFIALWRHLAKNTATVCMFKSICTM